MARPTKLNCFKVPCVIHIHEEVNNLHSQIDSSKKILIFLNNLKVSFRVLGKRNSKNFPTFSFVFGAIQYTMQYNAIKFTHP